MWARWMAVAFLCNGLGDFGLRVLQERGLAAGYVTHYLAGWYLAGAAGVAVLAARAGKWPSGADLAVGCGLGLFSIAGQTALGWALAGGVPGAVAYPAAKAGGVSLVALAGVLLFRERVGPAGLAGIALGVLAVALLALE